MEKSIDQRIEGKYIFGVKSKIGEFFYKHPWYATMIFFVVIEVTVFFIEKDLGAIIKSTKIILPLLIGNMVIARYFTRNYCYRVTIDKDNKTIIFYLMFNQGIIKEKINRVNVIIDKNCKIIINKKTFIVFAEMMHKIVAFLPENTEINYIGFFGRLKEKDWDKTNRTLKPGSQIK
jgi:hypothetical protein